MAKIKKNIYDNFFDGNEKINFALDTEKLSKYFKPSRFHKPTLVYLDEDEDEDELSETTFNYFEMYDEEALKVFLNEV